MRSGPGAAHDAAITALGVRVACVAIVAAWPALVRLAGRLNIRRAVVGAAGVAVAAPAIWLLAGYASTLTTFGGGVSHGRISYWKAAFDAWERRPILGFGAQTYFRAAAAFQAANDPTVFAHDRMRGYWRRRSPASCSPTWSTGRGTSRPSARSGRSRPGRSLTSPPRRQDLPEVQRERMTLDAITHQNAD